MRGRPIGSLAAALALLAALEQPTALAGGCERETVVRIRMPAPARSAGPTCWTYRGAATTFIGDFSHGRTISAQMSGEVAEYDPRSGRSETASRPRDPNVEGPGGFYFGDAEAPGALTFVAPANGSYRFSFSPCAMWHGLGTVRICAK